MQLYYCDESGVSYAEGKLHEITRGDQSKDPWYFLGAIAIPDRQRYDTYQLVSRLKNQYLRSLAPHGLLHERSVEAEPVGNEERALNSNAIEEDSECRNKKVVTARSSHGYLIVPMDSLRRFFSSSTIC